MTSEKPAGVLLVDLGRLTGRSLRTAQGNRVFVAAIELRAGCVVVAHDVACFGVMCALGMRVPTLVVLALPLAVVGTVRRRSVRACHRALLRTRFVVFVFVVPVRNFYKRRSARAPSTLTSRCGIFWRRTFHRTNTGR